MYPLGAFHHQVEFLVRRAPVAVKQAETPPLQPFQCQVLSPSSRLVLFQINRFCLLKLYKDKKKTFPY
jgi:hypothetical protein